MRRIAPHPIWIGHAGDGRDFTKLHEAGIRAIIQLAAEEPAIQPPRDFLFFRVPLFDGPGNRAECLILAIRVVSELLARPIPTLVCCGAGMSRSPGVVAASLAVTLREAPETSLGRVKSQGPCDLSPTLWNDLSTLVASWQTDPESRTESQRI